MADSVTPARLLQGALDPMATPTAGSVEQRSFVSRGEALPAAKAGSSSDLTFEQT